MQQSLQSIGASGCSAFEAVETAEWGYQGHPLLQEGDSSSSSSSGTSSVFPNRSLLSQLLHAVDDSSSSSSSSKFLGIRVLQQSLKGIEGLLGGNSSSSSILDLIERFVEDGKVLKGDAIGLSATHEAFGYNVQQMKTAAEKHYMTSLFAAAVDTLRPDDTYTALLSAHEVFSETVDKAIQGVTLPELELSIDLDPLAAATSGVQLAASEAADVGAFAAVLGPLLLWAEVALLFLDVEKVQDWMNEFGYMFVFDGEKLKANPSTQDLVDTFPEILDSGIQVTTRTVSLGEGKTKKVLGLFDVSNLLSPFSLEGFDTIGTKLIITSNYPNKDSAEFIKVLKEVEEEKTAEYKASGETNSGAAAKAKRYTEQLKNAVLLCRFKLQMLEETIPCYRYNKQDNPTKSTCKGEEFFGQPELGSWNIIEQSVYHLTVASRDIGKEIQQYAEQVVEYTREMMGLMERILFSLYNSLSCSFIKEHLLNSAYLACYEGIDRTWNAAALRAIGELCAVLLGLLLFIIWRMQKDNKLQQRLEYKQQKQQQQQQQSEQQPLRHDEETRGDVFDETGIDVFEHERETEQPIDGSSSMWA
ncbi:hypothetical protein, conserved [Eimeria acervulina]|uniref:Uncharacterized protein n=1 Tax=Eimeria acervulina TaxID=5801 RepID=U6G9W2_EIMAC|nr:hypothetical protein, conserved [Eimeria acervulina]CDI76332.1 hypothetical protein, conserved [Eimeria acervulina]